MRFPTSVRALAMDKSAYVLVSTPYRSNSVSCQLGRSEFVAISMLRVWKALRLDDRVPLLRSLSMSFSLCLCLGFFFPPSHFISLGLPLPGHPSFTSFAQPRTLFFTSAPSSRARLVMNQEIHKIAIVMDIATTVCFVVKRPGKGNFKCHAFETGKLATSIATTTATVCNEVFRKVRRRGESASRKCVWRVSRQETGPVLRGFSGFGPKP